MPTQPTTAPALKTEGRDAMSVSINLDEEQTELHLDEPLREALPPVVQGYEQSRHAEPWQIERMLDAGLGR